MRQHVVLNCENLPDAEKQRVQAIQQQKDAATEQKKHSKRSDSNNDGIGPSPVMPGGGNNSVDNHLNGTFGDMFNRLSNTHPSASGSADASFFSFSALGGNNGGGQDLASSSLAGTSSGLPGSLPTGNPSLDKQGDYKTGSSGGSKRKRKKEDSNTAAGVSSNWNLSSFLGGAGVS